MKKRLLTLLALVLFATFSFAAETMNGDFMVSSGNDFCQKLNSFLNDLNKYTDLNVKIIQCKPHYGYWMWEQDRTHITLSYEPLENSADQTESFHIIQFEYMGVHYINQIKKIIESLGLKFISQTLDSSITSLANEGRFRLSIGIPHQCN
ncbi:MAG: hypothetical protein HYW47_05345 [Deltaproteobacteria bacterium]|nr:hypothetical protein [Deltaproteobacteria bacterium]